MNPGLLHLQPYPFERLAALRKDVRPNPDLKAIALSIGEPQHPAPAFVSETILRHQAAFGHYPTTKGIPELRQAIADWLSARFALAPDNMHPDRNVLPVTGTREALFSFGQFVIDGHTGGTVLMPNPFYQIYEGAALLAGASPVYLNCLEENDFLPDFDAVSEASWRSCQLLFLSSPGNPTGAVIPRETLRQLIELSDQHGFVIASDECYSEIYPDEDTRPPGLLQVCQEMGRHDYANCVVFHSLSKRSNIPGMRTGFVAGDAALLEKYLQYRTYHGCSMPLPIQHASIAAWSDEAHVRDNRDLYRQKYAAVLPILRSVMHVTAPDATFYLWAETPMSDETFALRLYRDYNVSILPGTYLSRDVDGVIPGRNRIRISLVAPLDDCIEAAERMRSLLHEPE